MINSQIHFPHTRTTEPGTRNPDNGIAIIRNVSFFSFIEIRVENDHIIFLGFARNVLLRCIFQNEIVSHGNDHYTHYTQWNSLWNFSREFA